MKLKGKLKHFFVLLSLCFSSVTFSSVPVEKGEEKMVRNPKVLILGAGMAGVSAAKTLWDAGIRDFLVLEASGRVGGRVLKGTMIDREGLETGSVVELGANWVHGTHVDGKPKNPIWHMVACSELNSYNTMNALDDKKYIVLDENGDVKTSEPDQKSFTDMVEKCDKLEEEKKKEETTDMSKRKMLTECGWNPVTQAQKAIEYYVYDFDAAVAPEYISCGIKLKSDESEEKIDSEGDYQALVNDKRGYATIIEDMAKPFLEKIRHHKVKKIIKKEGDTKITVIVEGGQEFTGEHVLVTFSIGVLQKSMDTMFSPRLSNLPVGEALNQMEMANYLKIFMKFKQKFWHKKDYMFYAPEDDTQRRKFPVWQNLPGKKDKHDNEWDNAQIPDNENVILVTVTGPEAWALTATEKEPGVVKADIEKSLFGIFQKVFKSNLANLDTVPEELHVATHFKNWGDDELFLGAYSNPKVGTTTAHFNDMRNPVKEYLNRLYFAGEGTSEFYYGFLHGAYYTGKKQAEKIIKTSIKAQEAQNSLARGNMETGWKNVLQRNLGTTRNGTIWTTY
ncbi:polyamine oxidase 6-like [Dendronephthya gigantea]|uniref:polyamine oxidase 6-like n=1 Tax=Dendronephthya gigantea TaxID=151771 RepID=UPI0010698CE0|nr:polyamine oxidase 6-like [Dendronephthya gigantea]